jgi:hypothetical protein
MEESSELQLKAPLEASAGSMDALNGAESPTLRSSEPGTILILVTVGKGLSQPAKRHKTAINANNLFIEECFLWVYQQI